MNISDSDSNLYDIDGFLRHRLEKLAMVQSDPQTRSVLDAPFSIACGYPFNEVNEGSNIIDTSSPKLQAYDLSPTFSSYNDTNPHFLRSSLEAFFATRSRVVRLYNLPHYPETFLSAVFLPQSRQFPALIPTPITMWTLREQSHSSPNNCIWAVYRTHEEASAALFLPSPLSVATALESDLEPFHKLRRFILDTAAPSLCSTTSVSHPSSRTSSSHSDLQHPKLVSDHVPGMDNGDYTISSNPPNPKTSFRLGDWICTSSKCAAHNFGRNLACIGCGCPRSVGGTVPPQQSYPTSRTHSSPRFASFPKHSTLSTHGVQNLSVPQQPPYSNSQSQNPRHLPQPTLATSPPQHLRSAHPLLTPSGCTFAVGGRVQNISSDPLTPCIMYWPDNEPFPEQGQIRPGNLVGIPQPPILNTGNKGPISHQPGDWVCLKCNYLNWRRRKVCQTCLPYAEGNGDSISAAVQAERIALLTSVLAQAQAGRPITQKSPHQSPRAHSMTPPQQRRPFMDISPPLAHAPVHRSQSHFELGAHYTSARPIYQTPGPRHSSPPLPSTRPNSYTLPVHAPAPLLPSFLQDIIQSPALSPTSTSSADLSLEEREEVTTTRSVFPRTPNGSDDSAGGSPLGNIWRLDGEESKSLSVFALPNQQKLLGGRAEGRQKGVSNSTHCLVI